MYLLPARTHIYMTSLDPNLTLSEARSKQFHIIVKTEEKITRAAIIKRMNCSFGVFQHEYTNYLQEYPQIKYLKGTKEFVFDP